MEIIETGTILCDAANIKMTEKMRVVRHESNPFLQDMVIPTKEAQIRLSRMGKDDQVLVNQATGEIKGTHVVTYRKVDAAQFVKLFAQNVALTFGLGSAGIKALNVLIWSIQHNAIEKDVVPLDKYVLDEFVAKHTDFKPPLTLSPATFARGLVELEAVQIIAKHLRPGFFFLNPNFAFNGDRIAFTTLIERGDPAPTLVKKSKNKANDKQPDMFPAEK